MLSINNIDKRIVAILAPIVALPALMMAFALGAYFNSSSPNKPIETPSPVLSTPMAEQSPPLAPPPEPTLQEVVTPSVPNVGIEPVSSPSSVTDTSSDSETDTNQPPMTSSVLDKEIAEMRRLRDDAFAAYEKRLSWLEVDIIKKHTPEAWLEHQARVEDAKGLPDLLRATEVAKQAVDELATLHRNARIRVQLEDVRALYRQGDFSGYFKALTEGVPTPNFRLTKEDLDPLWKELESWDMKQWLAACQDAIRQMAPDDPGFGDIWFALADFHNELGNADFAKRAEEQAWNNIERITNPGIATRSALDGLTRMSNGKAVPSKQTERIESTYRIINQNTLLLEKFLTLADLAGIVGVKGDAALSAKYLEEACECIKLNEDNYKNRRLVVRARGISHYGSPSQLFQICDLNTKSDKAADCINNATSYAFAAFASARQKNTDSYWKAVLLAEKYLRDSRHSEYDGAYTRYVLAKADVEHKHIYRSIVSGVNLSAPNLKAGVLFPLIIDNPQSVPFSIVSQLVADCPSERSTGRVIASSLPYSTTPDTIRSKWIPWTLRLKQQSEKAGVFLAMARAKSSKLPAKAVSVAPPARTEANMDDPRDLMEMAETLTNAMEEPLDRVYARIWIALTWHKLGKTASYNLACERIHDDQLSSWQAYWEQQQKSHPYDQGSRESRISLMNLCESSTRLAEVQAFLLKDATKSIENCIDAMRGYQAFTQDDNQSFARIVRHHSIIEAAHEHGNLPRLLMATAHSDPELEQDLLLASKLSSHQGIQSAIAAIEAKNSRRSNQNLTDWVAYGTAKLAAIYAHQNKLQDYRDCRRRFQGYLTQGTDPDWAKLAMFEADALAGEFELAMKAKTINYSSLHFGSKSLPLSTLCVELSKVGRIEDALRNLPNQSEYYWRMKALHAIAAGRLSANKPDQLQWINSLPTTIDKIAAYCGTALKQPIVDVGR